MRKGISLVLMAFFVQLLFSNNVRVLNVVNTNPGQVNPILQFQIAWDNSWRVSTTHPYNYDAVWIFVKAQRVPVGSLNCESFYEWRHAKMTNVSAHFSVGAPLTYQFVTDSIGLFVFRSSDGIGNISPTNVQIRLKLPVPTAPFDTLYNFKVFAIEMVYIPQAPFELGDGSSTNTFNSILITSTTGSLTTGTIGGGINSTIPATYPNGFNAFYCMKYEISQHQYVEFLNTLTFDQQVTRTTLTAAQLSSDPGIGGRCAMHSTCGNRNGIKQITAGANNWKPAVFACDLAPAPADTFNSLNDGHTIAMNYLMLSDFYAYLDWAGLRPMTNFEFEKVARGPISRVANEYIWGNTQITMATSVSLNNPGRANEMSTVAGPGLAAFNEPASNAGPLRVGFSATSTTDRITSGAAYYGVMNLGGNLFEIVTGGSNVSSSGYALTYSDLGDGTLATNGNSNTSNWQTFFYHSSWGCYFWHVEFRGGNYSSGASTLRTSDRSISSACSSWQMHAYGNTGTESRLATLGGRGVR